MKQRGIIESYTDTSGVSQRTGKEYKRAELIIKHNEGYDNSEVMIAFTMFKKAMEEYSFRTGDEVEVSFRLESNKGGSRWFTNAIAYKIESVSRAPEPALNGDMANQFNESQDSDDMPF